MKTTKPIATISYNSTEFLDLKLSDLISSKKIEYYCYIVHLGEDDESGKKDHIHPYVEPARLIEAVRTVVLRQQDKSHLKPDAIPALLDEALPQQAITSAFRKYRK